MFLLLLLLQLPYLFYKNYFSLAIEAVLFVNMRLIAIFVTAVCVLFLIFVLPVYSCKTISSPSTRNSSLANGQTDDLKVMKKSQIVLPFNISPKKKRRNERNDPLELASHILHL